MLETTQLLAWHWPRGPLESWIGAHEWSREDRSHELPQEQPAYTRQKQQLIAIGYWRNCWLGSSGLWVWRYLGNDVASKPTCMISASMFSWTFFCEYPRCSRRSYNTELSVRRTKIRSNQSSGKKSTLWKSTMTPPSRIQSSKKSTSWTQWKNQCMLMSFEFVKNSLLRRNYHLRPCLRPKYWNPTLCHGRGAIGCLQPLCRR